MRELPAAVLIILVFDIPTGELVVKSAIILPVHPTCAMTVSLRNTPTKMENLSRFIEGERR